MYHGPWTAIGEGPLSEIEIRPLTRVIGAEIQGVDLRGPFQILPGAAVDRHGVTTRQDRQIRPSCKRVSLHVKHLGGIFPYFSA